MVVVEGRAEAAVAGGAEEEVDRGAGTVGRRSGSGMWLHSASREAWGSWGLEHMLVGGVGMDGAVADHDGADLVGRL